MDTLDKKLQQKLEEIKTILMTDGNESSKNISLLSGKTGEALFLFHYYEFTKDKSVLEKSYEILNSIFENLGDEYFSFGAGYAGIGWFLSHCMENEWLDVDANEILEDVDVLIYKQSLDRLRRGNYDFFHGATGGLVYFLSREDSKIKRDFIEKYVLFLDRLATEEDSEVTWDFYNFVKNRIEKGVYNLSLSHGIPSIISGLALAEKENIQVEICQKLIQKTFNYLIHHQLDPKIFNCCTPGSIEGKNFSRSRLAWCYGDLGVACSFWNIRKSGGLDEDAVLEKMSFLMNTSADRRNLVMDKVSDAGLCHGTAGNAHIFHTMYQRTQDVRYKEAAEFWFEQTLISSCFDDGLAGFKRYDGVNDVYLNERGFLEGIAGIGLAIISYLSPRNLSWDRALLIQ
jgi:lantibiotic modifying enzyme